MRMSASTSPVSAFETAATTAMSSHLVPAGSPSLEKPIPNVSSGILYQRQNLLLWNETLSGLAAVENGSVTSVSASLPDSLSVGNEVETAEKPFCERDERDMIRFGIFMGSMAVCLLGIVGNSITVGIFSQPKFLSSINVLISGLALFDIFFIISFQIVMIPFGISYYSGRPCTTMTGQWIVTIYVYPLNKMAQTMSVSTHLVITFERFLAVCFPFRAGRICTVRFSLISLFVVILYAIFFNLPRFWEYIAVPASFAPGKLRIDYGLRGNPMYLQIYTLWLDLMLMYLLPFFLLTLFNAQIVFTLRKASHNRNRFLSKQLSKIDRLPEQATMIVNSNNKKASTVSYRCSSEINRTTPTRITINNGSTTAIDRQLGTLIITNNTAAAAAEHSSPTKTSSASSPFPSPLNNGSSSGQNHTDYGTLSTTRHPTTERGRKITLAEANPSSIHHRRTSNAGGPSPNASPIVLGTNNSTKRLFSRSDTDDSGGADGTTTGSSTNANNKGLFPPTATSVIEYGCRKIGLANTRIEVPDDLTTSQRTRDIRQRRTTQMMSLIVFTFLLFHSLSLAISIKEVYTDNGRSLNWYERRIWDKLLDLNNFLVLSNSAVNFIIYYRYSGTYRMELIKACRIFTKTLHHSPTTQF